MKTGALPASGITHDLSTAVLGAMVASGCRRVLLEHLGCGCKAPVFACMQFASPRLEREKQVDPRGLLVAGLAAETSEWLQSS